VAEVGLSFGLLASFRRPRLRAGGNLVARWSVLVLAMLEVLIVIVIIAIGVVVPVLLWSELVHLLRARSELVGATITSHGHCKRSVSSLAI
jgi:hypothetical protein